MQCLLPLEGNGKSEILIPDRSSKNCDGETGCLVFGQQSDRVYSNIHTLYPATVTEHLSTHFGAADEIVKMLRGCQKGVIRRTCCDLSSGGRFLTSTSCATWSRVESLGLLGLESFTRKLSWRRLIMATGGFRY